MVGRPGEAKSFLTTDMAARISTGSRWPDGTECPSGSVLMVCAEDDPADTIRPRLDAHAADSDRVHLMSMTRSTDEHGAMRETLFTLADVASLRSALKQIKDCKLVIIDPIGSFLGGRTDAHRDNEVRGVLGPVAQVAEEYGPAVVMVSHTRKGSADFADDTAMGSRAFTGIARATWHVSRDQQNRDRRLFLPGKNNLSHETSGMAFSVDGDPPAVRWEPEPVDMHADDAMNHVGGGGQRGTERGAATEWLADYLTDELEPSSDVFEAAGAMGFSMKTVRRAYQDMGGKPQKMAFDGGWGWALPVEDAQQ